MASGDSVKEMTSKFEKLNKFEGQDFRRWQKKMKFLLTTLKVVYVLSTPMPVLTESVEDEPLEATRRRSKWENDDYICRGHILNELWDSLESKYMAEDASSKKFLVSNFMSYKMIDSRPVMEQFHEMLRILGQFTQHNLKMDEAIYVAVIIDKLPPYWKEFKHNLKHNKEELTLTQLGSHLRIEESIRTQELDNNPKGKNQVGSSSVNMVEGESSKNPKKSNGKMKFKRKDDKSSNKKAKLDDKVAWWVDSGATSHVCKDLYWFKDFQPIEDGSVVKMGNVATEPIKGIGSVLLTFTSGKCLCLNKVLYVPGIRKNLVSEIVLNNCGYKQVLVPNLSYLKVWGCKAVVRLIEPKRKTLGERGIDCIFIGYVENSKAYRFYVLESNDYVSVNTVIESRDVIFDEERFTSIPRPRDMIHQSSSKSTTQAEDVSGGASFVPEPRRSTRARKAKSFGSDFQLYLVEGTRNETISQHQYCFNIEEDPKTFSEAMDSRDVHFWKEAIHDEIGSIMHNNTWVLADLPPGCKALGCKWILKRKMKVDGTIDKYKARLVIQGFRQKEGIDFFDTYAHVARISTIRLLLALAAIHNLVIHQMDVKTAFLNGDLDEEIYMKQPEGFVMPGNEHKVCKLKKSLYGLKQAPKQWHQKFDDVVLSNGFALNQADRYVYSKFDTSGKGVMICLYVDDMLILLE
uniref:Zinc finger, CCHC-type n=1 Tax=Lactuca sativa TaxID=4236 RepID=A0A9R1X4A4_LACSA|nr:hypothetical protein LSAT_V11C700346810 [Lactuca sativa]